jgi:alanine-synthesizing transaminase
MIASLDGISWGQGAFGIQTEKARLLATGRVVCDLSMVNPDIPPPRFLIDKLCEASVKGVNHRYAVSRGVRKLREALTDRYHHSFGVSLSPESDVCVTLGSKDALTQIALVLLKPGDEILVGEPTYAAFRFVAEYAGLVVRTFPLSYDQGEMAASIEAVLAAHPIRAVFLNFPNNPTGQTVAPEFYRAVLTNARRTNTLVVNDFVYGEMTYSGTPAVSLLKVAEPGDAVLETFSLSKAFSVPGWRVGAVLGASRLVREIAVAKSRVDYGLFLPIQIAAAAALTSPEPFVRQITEQYRNRAEVLTRVLQGAGWRVVAPEAGASVWAQIPERFLAQGSDTIVRRLVSGGLVTTSETFFGADRRGFIRFALVASEDRLLQLAEVLRL